MPSLLEGLVAAGFVLHGIAHLVGFVAPWRLLEMKEVPYKTTVLGGAIDLGDAGIRVVGVIWLVATIAFAASGMGLLVDATWWRDLAFTSIAMSVVLTIVEWPRTKAGLVMNVALLAVLLADTRFGLLPAS